MTRDPLLPVRLVDGVWTTKEPQTAEAKHRQEHLVAELMSAEAVELGRSLNRDLYPPPDDLPPSTGARPFPCFPDPDVSADVVLPVDVDADALRDLAEHNPNTAETAVSFDAEATCPGEEPIPVRAVLIATPKGDDVTPTRADVLTTLYTLVNDEQMRMYACNFAGFPRERLPSRGVSLADLAAVVVDTATPDVWARFVDALAGERPGRDAEIALLRCWVPGSPPPRRIFTLVALDGSGVHGIGADLAAAQAHALSTRDDGDPAWLDTLRAVTLSGEPAAVQALVDSLSSLPAGGDVWEGT